MKKGWSVFLSGLMTVNVFACGALLSGCGEALGASVEGRLSVWVPEGQKIMDMFEDMAADFEAETGTPVSIIPYMGLSATEKLELDGPFGKGGDIYIQNGGGDLAGAVEKGLFMALSSEELGLDTALLPGMSELMEYQGVPYGVPLGAETNVMFYNKEILPEFPEDWTWQDMVEWAKTYNHFGDTIATQDSKYGLVIEYTNPYYTWAINEAFGGYIFGTDADGNYVATDIGIDNEGSIAASEYIMSMIDEKVLPENMGILVCINNFSSGRAAIIMDGSWSLSTYRNAGIDVGAALIPDIQLPSGELGTPRPFSGAYGLSISSFTLNEELSKEFLKFAMRDEYILAYHKATGRIPTTVSCSQIEEIANDEVLKVFTEQMEVAFPQPPINELNAVWEPLLSAGQAIYVNRMDAATVLHKVKNDVIANIELLG